MFEWVVKKFNPKNYFRVKQVFFMIYPLANKIAQSKKLLSNYISLDNFPASNYKTQNSDSRPSDLACEIISFA